MKTEDELHLVRTANDYINRLRQGQDFFSGGLGIKQEDRFFAEAAYEPRNRREDIIVFIAEMSDETLGMIVGLGIVTDAQLRSSHYRATRRMAGLGVESLDVTSWTGHRFLVSMAFSVILPAMYDILHAERVIREKMAQSHQDAYEKSTTPHYSSWPKPAMKNFVVEQRMKR